MSTPSEPSVGSFPGLLKADRSLSDTQSTPSWTPIPLRKRFAISLITLMVLVAVALEIALHFSRVKHGWGVPNNFSATTGIMHYVYTLPPVAVAMVIVALWAWTDLEMKRMQPYIDLAYGDAPASKSMLLDYATQHAAIASISAYKHNHYIVAVSSVLVLVGLIIQPLAASLFTVRDTWGNQPNANVTSFDTPGLNPNFRNLTSFTSAAGFVQANVLYNATPPNFVIVNWSVAHIQVPTEKVKNGTMSVNTTSVQSSSHCKPGTTGNITPFSNNTGFIISGSSDGCAVSLPVQSTGGTLQYGVDVVTCPTNPPPDLFKPVVFWVISRPDPSASPAYSLVFCTPTISFLDVNAQVALQTGSLLSTTVIRNYSQPNDITDPNGFMKGRAMNGVGFDLTNADSITIQQAQAARLGLATAVVQNAQQSPGGLQNQIQSSGMAGIMGGIYDLYLSLIARSNYFVPSHGFISAEIKTFRPRLWIVDTTAHILTGVLLTFAVICSFIHIAHSRLRHHVVLPLPPGTLAAAATFTARSNVADVLDGYLDQRTIKDVLENKRFRIDRGTGRIVMHGDQGFEDGEAIPVDRRRSILQHLRLFNEKP